jgi:hypothetical protein
MKKLVLMLLAGASLLGAAGIASAQYGNYGPYYGDPYRGRYYDDGYQRRGYGYGGANVLPAQRLQLNKDFHAEIRSDTGLKCGLS